MIDKLSDKVKEIKGDLKSVKQDIKSIRVLLDVLGLALEPYELYTATTADNTCEFKIRFQ